MVGAPCGVMDQARRPAPCPAHPHKPCARAAHLLRAARVAGALLSCRVRRRAPCRRCAHARRRPRPARAQMASALGEAGSLMALRCQPAEPLPPVALPPHLRLWGVDSGIRHRRALTRPVELSKVGIVATRSPCTCHDVSWGRPSAPGKRLWLAFKVLHGPRTAMLGPCSCSNELCGTVSDARRAWPLHCLRCPSPARHPASVTASACPAPRSVGGLEYGSLQA